MHHDIQQPPRSEMGLAVEAFNRLSIGISALGGGTSLTFASMAAANGQKGIAVAYGLAGLLQAGLCFYNMHHTSNSSSPAERRIDDALVSKHRRGAFKRLLVTGAVAAAQGAAGYALFGDPLQVKTPAPPQPQQAAPTPG